MLGLSAVLLLLLPLLPGAWGEPGRGASGDGWERGLEAWGRAG